MNDRKRIVALMLAAAGCAAAVQTSQNRSLEPMAETKLAEMKRLTPILVVEKIEPCLDFWVGKLGFTKGVEVPGPDGQSLGFVILNHGPIELMYQTRASVAADVPAFTKEPMKSTLFLEVGSLTPIRTAIAGLSVAVPERTTFYGTREIVIREPGGHFITFAEHVATPKKD